MLVVVVLDQVTKYLAIQNLSSEPSREILGRFLMFSLIFNKGGALGTSFGSSTYYLVSGILILGFLLYYVYHYRNYTFYSWPLALIAGGAIGNLIDRIRFGRVVDFIDVDFFDIDILGFHLDRWWTFNIADAAISCSLVFLLVFVLFVHRRSPQPPTAPSENGSGISDA